MFSPYISSTNLKFLTNDEIFYLWNQNSSIEFNFKLKNKYNDFTTFSKDEFGIPMPSQFNAKIDIFEEDIYNLTVLKPIDPKFFDFDLRTIQYYNLFEKNYYIKLSKYIISTSEISNKRKRDLDDFIDDFDPKRICGGELKNSKRKSLNSLKKSRSNSNSRSKLVSIKPSNDGKHKYVATFTQKSGRSKQVRFGAKGMDDYTRTKNKEQRNRYRSRHKKDLNTRDPTRAGYLSYHILWGDSPSIQENIRSYKRRFSL